MATRFVLPSVLLLTLLIVDFRPGSHFAAQPGVPAADYVSDELIVKFRAGVGEDKKDLARFRVFGTRKKIFRIVPGLEVIKLARHVSIDEAIQIYRRDPDVVYAEPNYILRTMATPNDPRFNEMWGLNNVGQSGGTPDADIDATEAWEITKGSSSVIIGVIDSGVDYTHPDLAGNLHRNEIVGQYSECIPNGIDDDGNGYIDDCYGIDTFNNDSDPRDDNGHGTHVAGTIGALGDNNRGVVGINWNVRMMACKFVNASGSGTTEKAIDCLEYFKVMKDRGFNIVATSNSWGGGGFSQALFDAIDAHRQRGMLFIAAAGNGNFFGIGLDNDATPFYPCTYYLPNIICVASTTRTDARSTFSNYGRRTVHIGAPGSDILSTYPGNTYRTSSGTSMATPHVTGVAALLKSQDDTRDWTAIRNLILASGDSISSLANTITQKRLNANGALTCLDSTLQSRLRPIGDAIQGSLGVPIELSALHIRCAQPNGEITVTIEPGNEVVTLVDNGQGSDQSAGDGVYSGQWTPLSKGNFTLTFTGGEVVNVSVDTPLLSVTPNSQDFGAVNVGDSSDRSFTVKNIGSGTVTGSASTNPPYSVVSGGNYSLGSGQSQNVTVRFTPTEAGTFLGSVNFTGGEGASASVSGVGTVPASIGLTFGGKLKDRVGRGNLALTEDGSADATFTVTLQVGSGPRTVTRLELRRTDASGVWNTTSDQYWVLGAAAGLDASLYNSSSDSSVNFAVAEGASFNLFAADGSGSSYFPEGSTFRLTSTFADGSTATADVIISGG